MLKIENVKISDIIPYKHNAKEHPAEQVAQIAASIRQFGMNDPVAIDEENVIIEGHGRLLAIQKMQAAGEYTEETVPCIRLTHLTDQQKKAYILAHNKLTMNTGFDLDILSDELERITDFDMSDFGFLDEASEDKLPKQKDALISTLPDSRVMVCSISAFGTDSEIFIESILPQDTVDHILGDLFKKEPQKITEKLTEALNAL